MRRNKVDTEKFKLTSEELGNLEWTETPAGSYAADFSFIDDYQKEIKVILENQVIKVLSMLEPVGLEELGDEEMKRIINLNKQMGNRHFYEAGKRLVQATIQKNQSKGQLYRLKETK